jgi:hypothetical protein
VSDAVSYGIELLVGLACAAAAVPVWRGGGRIRCLAALLVVGGIAASVHAIAQLA